MTTVNFPPELGGDDVTIDDTDNPSTGLGNGGHRLRFLLALQQFLKVALWCKDTAMTVLGHRNDAAASASAAEDSASSASGSAAAAASSAGAAAATKGQIDSRYYGPLASDPTTRPDSSSMQSGDRYFNTVSSVEKVYNGSIWIIPNVASSDLANASDSAKGAALVGYSGGSVRSALDKFAATNNAALPGNDFNQALSNGHYAGFGDSAGGASSANAPVGSGNVRMDVMVLRGANSITQFAVAAASSVALVWFRAAYVPSGDYAAALAAAPWHAMPTLDGPNIFKDVALAQKSLIDVEHYGNGTNNGGQTYGVDIHNYPGARSALVLHQYSGTSPAFWLDNTDNAPAFRINNTHNATLNPGGPPTAQGDFQEWLTEGISKLRFRYDYVFEAYQVTPTFYRSEGQALSIQTPNTVSADTAGIVRAYPTNSGAALGIQNSGGTGLRVLQNGPGIGVSVAAAAGAAGFYAELISGYDYGGKHSTSANGGRTLEVEKNGTGSGEAMRITNKGSGGSLAIRDATSERFAIMSDGLPKWSSSGNVQYTTGAAGGANALPAAPSKYLKVIGDDGVTYVIPAYLAG